MSDLETFRAETRAWLEANCPPEMREPVRDEEDALTDLGDAVSCGIQPHSLHLVVRAISRVDAGDAL